MISHRKSNDRGFADHGWLKSYHTFSFAGYYDPNHIHFRTLRVVNEDWIEAGNGFPTHGHDNMEIITVVISGSLEHRDSMGNTERIHAGEVQVMSAGSGITHSEFNPSDNDPLHLFQIWIFPRTQNSVPRYDQADFSNQQIANEWGLLVSDIEFGARLTIDQDIRLFQCHLNADKTIGYELAPNRHAFIQIVTGTAIINGVVASAGDAIKLSGESFEIKAVSDARVLMFDLN